MVMELIFTNEYTSLLVLLNGLAVLFYLGSKKKNRQRALKFGNYETLQKVAGKNFLKSSNLVLLTRLLALTALIIGISNPVLVRSVPTSNSDYVIAIDSSGSMLADDIEPSRFEAAKQLSSDFIGKLGNETQIGVVSFSGDVKKVQEMTTDKSDARASIIGLESGDSAGTAIGDAISTSVSMLISSNRSRTVLIITDGRNNVGSAVNESVEFALNHNTTINTIGIGSKREQGSNFGNVEGVNASRAGFPNLDQAQLASIANSTGGSFLTVSNRSTFQSAFIELEDSERQSDISTYFIFLAAGLLMVEWVLGTTKYSVIP